MHSMREGHFRYVADRGVLVGLLLWLAADAEQKRRRPLIGLVSRPDVRGSGSAADFA